MRLCSVFLILAAIVAGCKKKHTAGNGDGGDPVVVKPTILSLNTYSGPYNTVVQINGNGFDADTLNDKVWFNGKPARITAASATKITVNVPLSAGTGKVTLTVNNGDRIIGPVFNYQYTMMVTTLANHVQPLGSTDPKVYQNLERPTGITVDATGNVYVCDFGLNMIYRVDTAGKAIVLSGQATPAFVNGDVAHAMYNFPFSLATDGNGDIYVVDRGNYAFRKISRDGMVTTFASGSFYPSDTKGGFKDIPSLGITQYIVVDKNHTLYYTDDNGAVRTVNQNGETGLYAGYGYGYRDGPRLKASFSYLHGLAFDGSGNLFVADWGNNLIRKIGVDGNVTTLAGSTTPGFVNGKGKTASFNNPDGIAVDVQGNVYVAEPGNNAIRKITPAGIVTTFAGTGTAGNKDGDLDKASFYAPTSIAVDKNGLIYVADTGNKSIRKIGHQ